MLPDKNRRLITRATDGQPLPVWRVAFLSALALTGNVTAAARAAGINRTYAYQVYEANPDFAADWREAIEQATDLLEEAARKRALGELITYKFTKDGDPILHPISGEPYYEHVASDALLTLLLKAHRPEKFTERREVVTTKVAAPAYDLSKLNAADLAALREMKRKMSLPAADGN